MRIVHSRTAAIIVFASTVTAGDAKRPSIAIGGNHRVPAVQLARSAVVVDRVPGAIRPFGHAGDHSSPSELASS